MLAQRAYVWGYPLVRAGQIRENATMPDDPFGKRLPTSAGAPINRVGNARELATPDTKLGVAPNNDTLYTMIWLDLDHGPYVLRTPDFGSRYYTFQMGHADSSTDVSLGQRTSGSHLQPVFIHAYDDHRSIPKGMVDVTSRQRYLMVAGRILVAGTADLPNVWRLQNQITLTKWDDRTQSANLAAPVTAQRPLGAPDSHLTGPLRFMEMLGNVLHDWRVPPAESALVASFKAIGLDTTKGFRPEQLDQVTRERVLKGLEAGRAEVRCETLTLGKAVNGWAINLHGSQFDENYLLRAAVAMDQIYVLPAAEALYPNARVDKDGRELDGHNSYLLSFGPHDLPPVQAFWSLTMYFAKGFLVPNPIQRYSIGDRTPGLVFNKDGGLDILLQNQSPRGRGTANWLPAPSGPFMLMMRLYRPKPAASRGEWAPPVIREILPR